MKKLLQFLLGTLLFVIASCDSDVPAPYPIPQAQADKTVFVYMPWSASRSGHSGSLYDAFQQNLRDMKTAIQADGGLGKNRVIVFISTSGTTAVMMEITYAGGICKQDTLETYNAANIPAFTTSSGISRILNRVKRQAPANQYAMIIGCHGTGWLFSNGGRSRVQTRYFGGTEPYTQTNIPVLADGIKDAGMKMQFVMFDDCYMSNVEVAYELRHVADHLIGCCSEIMAYGMPYHQMWKYLVQPLPDYWKVVETFHNFYSTYSYPYGNIGVTDCRYAEEMAGVMRIINSRFTLSNATSVQRLDGYHDVIFYDMGDYVSKLCTDPVLYADFQTTLDKLVPFKAHTPMAYTALGQLPSPKIPVSTFSGLTISDPTVSTFERAAVNKKLTSWWAATH